MQFLGYMSPMMDSSVMAESAGQQRPSHTLAQTLCQYPTTFQKSFTVAPTATVNTCIPF